jgi:hypothetical protein
MFKGITGGQHIVVSNGNPMTPYIPAGNQSAGMLRYNSNSQNIEVYDGSIWKELTASYASVDLNHDAQNAISWAKGKMKDEAELEKLAKEHPAINLALDNLKKAQRQLDATIILSKEHEKTTS